MQNEVKQAESQQVVNSNEKNVAEVSNNNNKKKTSFWKDFLKVATGTAAGVAGTLLIQKILGKKKQPQVKQNNWNK